jgi:hypothetical protein
MITLHALSVGPINDLRVEFERGEPEGGFVSRLVTFPRLAATSEVSALLRLLADSVDRIGIDPEPAPACPQVTP